MTAETSKLRLPKQKAELNSAPDDISLWTCQFEVTDQGLLPFPEFSDPDINAERWDKALQRDKISSLQTTNEDPQEVRLPPDITVREWKRCVDINPHINFVVFSPISEYPDLITPNRHLLKNEFYKNFISSIETLLFIGCTKPFQQEYDTPVFSSGGVRSWRPWHHIYSNCKITKGEHSPVYTSSGKYVVRLFWLGAWRKIYVDDTLPLDISGNVLLPSFRALPVHVPANLEEVRIEKPSKGKSKGVIASPASKETYELWPMLLCKALLKIASLSSFREFDLIHCLTGWLPQKVKTKDISSGDLWDMLTAYVPHFEWPEIEESVKKTGSTKSKSKGKESAPSPKRDVKEAIPSGIEYMKQGDRFVVVFCGKDSQPAEEHTVSDCESRSIYISEIRDVPIIKPPPRPELEFWKTFRYEKWAVENGVIPPDIKKLKIRSLKVVDPFKRLIHNDAETEPLSDVSLPAPEIDNTDKKSDKSHKSKKTQKSEKTTLLEPDPSMWKEFSDIQDKISHFTIYFQPRTFKSKNIISDLNFTHKTPDFNYLSHPYILKKSKNAPIYVFMDSIDYKFLVVNLAQMGTISALDKDDEEEELDSKELEDLDICDEILLKKTKNKDIISKPPSQEYYKYSDIPLQNHPVSLVLEEYRWESNTIGPPRAILNTIGNKSFIIDLKPGRVSFRLWISSNYPYVLQVFSDTTLSIGNLDGYLTASSVESQLLTNLCYDMASCFGKLVQSFGMPEYSVSLRNFYESYKPIENVSKRERATIHRIFFEELCKIINEQTTILYSSSFPTVDAVKLLFLQLKTFDYISPYTEEPHLCPEKFPLDDQVEYAKTMQRAAVKVQAFFKMIYIKRMLKKMNDDHKQYYQIFDSLKRIYIELFSSEKRLTYCPVLIRRFFEHPEMNLLSKKFHICHDIESVLELRVYNGSSTPQESCWVSFCRYEFFIIAQAPIPIKISLFCNLQKYRVRVFNNDNLREIKRTLDGVIVDAYSRNSKGYTILCYGWNYDSPKVNWKLVVAYKKMSRNDLVLIPGYISTTLSFKDQYVPNFENIICRYKLRVGTDTLLTANLTTSYNQAQLCFRLLDRNGKVLREVSGNKSVLIPLIDLRCFAEETVPTEVPQASPATASPVTASKKLITTMNLHGVPSVSKFKKHDMEKPRPSAYKRTNSIGSDNSAYHRRGKKTGGSDADDETSSLSADDNKLLGSKSKTGSRSALTTRSRTLSRGAISLSKGIHLAQTAYVLEAKVVGNSWPLTGEEWQRVRKLQEKNYLNLLEERRPISKKSTAVRKLSSMLIEPFWVLDLIYVAGSSVEFEQDLSQAENRKNEKILWFADIERYKKGMSIREKYLEEHSVPKTDSITDKLERTNDPKDFATDIVPEIPLNQYMTKPLEEVDEDCCKTKSDDDYIIEEAHIEYIMKQYEAEEIATQEEIDCQLQEQSETFDVLSTWFEEIRNDSQDMIAEVHAMKREYLERMLHKNGNNLHKNGKRDKKKK